MFSTLCLSLALIAPSSNDLIKVVQAIVDADYRGNRAQLDRSFDEAAKWLKEEKTRSRVLLERICEMAAGHQWIQRDANPTGSRVGPASGSQGTG